MYLFTWHLLIAFSIIYLFFCVFSVCVVYLLVDLATDLSPSIFLYRDYLAVIKASKETNWKVRVQEAGVEACG